MKINGIFGYIGQQDPNKPKTLKGVCQVDQLSDNSWVCNGYDIEFETVHDALSATKEYHSMQNRDGKALIFCGEIFNKKALIAKLQDSCLCQNSSQSAEEIAFHALCHWSIDEFLQEVNGVFAFAFYDALKQQVILVRDHLGTKSLYYSTEKNSFSFSTEIKYLFDAQCICPGIRKELLGEYFAQGWICEPDTLFCDINKVRAGEYLVIDLHPSIRITSKTYWHIYDHSSLNAMPDLVQIVKDQYDRNLTMGNFFSGGIDSSLLTAIIAEEVNPEIQSIHLQLGDSESERVQAMMKKYNLNIQKVEPDLSYCKQYPQIVYAMDEPVADPAIIAAYDLSIKARQRGFQVMFSGMGGDEIDAGYPRAKVLRYWKFLKLLTWIPYCFSCFLHGKKRRDFLRLYEFASATNVENYFNLFGYFSHSEIDSLVGREWFNLYRQKVQSLTNCLSGKKRFFYYDFIGFLASHNNIYGDKMAIASSVGCRFPLLDKNIAHYFFQKIDAPGNAGKRRLCNMLKQKLGTSYHYVRKSGFRFPVDDFLRNMVDWKEVEEQLLFAGVQDLSLFHKNLSESKKNMSEVYMKLWTYYTLATWVKVYFKGNEKI